MKDHQPTYSSLNQYDTTKTGVIADLSAIYQSFENIIETSPGERLFNPMFGSFIEEYLFDPLDGDTALRVENEIIRAVGRWEKRIVILNNLTTAIPNYTTNSYDIKIAFRVKGIENQVFDYNASLVRRVSPS
jgi:phage baseplate assembly protein W